MEFRSSENKKENPPGILRIDSGRSRRTSLELKYLKQKEPASPQPSVDRLSVTFADESLRSDRSDSSKCNYFNPASVSSSKMDKVHFTPGTDAEESDEEDYSASVQVIMQRRASTRKSTRRRSSRRSSSPFSPDILPDIENNQRRASIFTTSSGDTAITMDENYCTEITQEEIFENIKLHKEVLQSVKMQPWNMRKKLKLVVQAKNYIKKHEGVLQERLAQSHSTRDMLARWNLYLIKKWQIYRREMVNLSNWFIPWEKKIKEIESHFGSVVASYFVFLRWLFWVNVVLATLLICFVAVPEVVTADPKAAGDRKFILAEEKYNSTNFLTLWDFEGVFKYSPLFYGWYTFRDDGSDRSYRLPFAYFITGLVAYAYSFFATLRKMAENSRMSKLSEKDDECIFSWKLFTAWDHMIGNAETAHNRVASIVVGFKEALLEEAEKKRASQNWKVIAFRILVNTAILGLLSFSAFAVIWVVKRSTEPEAGSTVWRRNEITVVMSLISLFFPMIFEVLGLLEKYHPRKQLRLQLARIMVLNLLNLYSLIFALFDKIIDMTTELEEFKNRTSLMSMADTASQNPKSQVSVTTPFPATSCYEFCTSDIVPSSGTLIASMAAALVANISSTTLPHLQNFLAKYETPTTEPLDSNSTEPYLENIQDLEEYFIEYLNYVLLGFSENSTWTNSTFNSTDSNFTSSPLNFTDYVTNFEETSPYPNVTDFDQRFETDLNSLISSTLSSVTDISFKNSTNCTQICQELTTVESSTSISENSFNFSTRAKLRSLCWETMFGQELIKLTVMDLLLTVLSTLAMDFLRGVFVRVMNRCWCWDLEKNFPQYGDFKVAENILHLVNNQGMVWMGMFFSPGLVVLNVIKLYAMVYLRAWAVLTCNVPHEIIFRASRSNNFYFALLLMMLFLCVLPVGYAIVWIKPSWHCGPFSQYQRIFHIFTKTIKHNVPPPIEKALDYIASPGIVIPLLVLLILVIYYLISLTNSLREANNDLKIQLRRERTEERRKVFQLADRRRRGGSSGSGDLANNPFAKWKKLLSTMPSTGRSFDDVPKQESTPAQEEKAEKSKVFFSKLIKKALAKSSTSEEADHPNLDEGTDTEQHESLPEDIVSIKQEPAKPHRTARRSSTMSSNSFDIHKAASNLLLQKRNNKIITEAKVAKLSENPEESREVGGKPKSPEMRQDSGSSIRSENIPVIKISKTESAECLEVVSPKKKPEVRSEPIKNRAKHKSGESEPNSIVQLVEAKSDKKVKKPLKKQNAEVDEDKDVGHDIKEKFKDIDKK